MTWFVLARDEPGVGCYKFACFSLLLNPFTAKISRELSYLSNET